MVLCSAFLFITLSSKAQVLDPTQVYTTGNIVQTTPQGGPTPWVNGVYQNSLTCWGWGDPGYCGPNPIVRPGDSINFSYGSTYLYQQQAVSSLLPSATGLQVTGYNFGFMAKNGNGWDDGRTDNLMALVRFWDTTGGRSATNLLYGDVYSLNYKFNWTSFDYSKTFTTPLAVSSIGQVQYGFIGSDNNGWAGPYGPEIYNVSFSLKYKVDPCASNVLSSPSCPGYLDALAKLSPPVVTNTVTIEPIVTMVAPTTNTTVSSAPTTTTTTPTETQSVQQSTSTSQGAVALAGPQQTSVAQAAPSATPTKIGEVTDSSGSSKSTVSLSSVLSMIGSNQEKTAALEKSVVQAADAQAFSAGETAKQNAEKIAGEAQSQSIAISNSQLSSISQGTSTQSFSGQPQTGAIALQGNLQSNTVFNAARLEQSLASVSVQSYSNTSQTQQTNQTDSKQEFAYTVPQTVGVFVPRIAPTTSSETNTAPAGVYVPQKEIISNVENIVPQSSVYVPKTFTQSNTEATETQVASYIPKSTFSETIENIVPQSSVYVPKVFQPTIIENTVTQSTQTISVNRIQQEVKQEVAYSSSQMGLQAPKYEPPKVESSFAPTAVASFQYTPPVVRQEYIVSMVTPSTSYSLITPTRQSQQVQIEMPTLEGIKFGHKGPVDNAMEAKPLLPQMNTGPQQTDTVKKNVQNNELAGGVSIESIAKQPANYAQYFSMIPDSAFYEPKEIYKNQKTIDNTRVLRGLTGGSDARHQEMINQQYKLGN